MHSVVAWIEKCGIVIQWVISTSKRRGNSDTRYSMDENGLLYQAEATKKQFCMNKLLRVSEVIRFLEATGEGWLSGAGRRELGTCCLIEFTEF